MLAAGWRLSTRRKRIWITSRCSWPARWRACSWARRKPSWELGVRSQDLGKKRPQLPTPNSQLPTPNSQLPTPNSLIEDAQRRRGQRADGPAGDVFPCYLRQRHAEQVGAVGPGQVDATLALDQAKMIVPVRPV